MSNLPFCHSYVDGESNRSPFSFPGTESEYGYHVLERTSHLHSVCQVSHTPSSACPERQRCATPSNNWPVDLSIHTLGSAAPTQFGSPSFPLPQTSRAAPIPLYASGSSLPYAGYSTRYRAVHPLISESHPPTVAMPIMARHAEYGGGLMDACPYHYDHPFGNPQDDYMVEYPRAIPSSFIAMPIIPTSLGASVSSHADPVSPSDPTPLQPPRHLTTTFQHSPLPGSTTDPSSPGSFGSEYYSSPSPPSIDNYTQALAVSPPEPPDQIPSQPDPTTSPGQLYTLTVPLEAVEFPPISGAREILLEVPFFQCRWADCGVWITSEKEAVKHHLTHTHDVELRGKSTDSAYCEWIGCSSSLQKSGLIRHFHTHLGLKWLCSVCKGAYTRQDSVGFHGRREPRCQLAHAVSHPSAVAYSARINRDDTVTLTKVLKP